MLLTKETNLVFPLYFSIFIITLLFIYIIIDIFCDLFFCFSSIAQHMGQIRLKIRKLGFYKNRANRFLKFYTSVYSKDLDTIYWSPCHQKRRFMNYQGGKLNIDHRDVIKYILKLVLSI